jgi:two-component sensor histidine kinase
MISTHFSRPHRPNDQQLRLIDLLARQTADYLERREADAALRRREAWLAGQKEAFQRAMNGDPLGVSLEILIRTALEQAEDDRRCAFYLASPDNTELRHVAGMPPSYARCVDGFKIGPESLACGLAAWKAQPIITKDVTEEPLWQPWLWLAREYGYRGCWSFPVETSAGRVVGTFAMYFKEPREPSSRDRELILSLTQSAAIIISHHMEAQERAQAEAALRSSESQLRAYVAASFDVVYRMSPDWSIMRYLDGKEFIADTLEPSSSWLQKYIHPNDQPRVLEAINEAMRMKHTFELEHPVVRADGTTGWTFSRAIPLLDENGLVTEWLGAATDITLRKQHEEHQRLLIDELNHRVKNTLATIQSLAVQTFRSDYDPEHAREQFVVRLLALAKAHDILTRENWKGAPLNEIVDGAIAAYRVVSRERFELEGPRVSLAAKQALALSMALHELCTNAVKYGALSNDKGRVRILWSISGLNGAKRLQMQWTEVGGPPVKKPTRSGFGSRLIERGLARDLRGKATLDFGTSGLRCVIEAPLEH